MNRFLCMLLLVATSSVYADEIKPEVTPDVPPIQFPKKPVLVEPETINVVPKPVVPQFTPEVIEELPAATWYIIETIDKQILLDSPLGFVTIKEYDVSATTRSFVGRIADGTGAIDEERICPTRPEYKYVYSILATKPGTIELLMGKEGATSKTMFVRQRLVVMGKGPQPPPIDPDVTPVPVDPEPVPVPKPTGIRVLLLYEETANRDQLNTVNSSIITAWMNDNCAKDTDGRPGWRRWDGSSTKAAGVSTETETWKKLWGAVEPQIQQPNTVFVITDTKVHSEPMTTPDNALAFMQRIKEGR